MNKKWLLVGAVARAGCRCRGCLRGRPAAGGGLAGAMAKAKPDGKKEVTLEFTPREVVQPQLARLPARLEFSGPLVAPQTAVVRAKAGGTLLALAVAEGSRVRAGQTLGRSTWPSASRVADAPPASRAARATLAQAERTHARTSAWRRSSSSRPIALDGSRAAVDTARAAAQRRAGRADTARVGLREAGAGGAHRRHRRQAPRGAGREAQRRAAGADHRRPGPAGTGRPWARTRWRAWRRHAGAGAGGRRGAAGGRAHRAHRAGGRAGHALDRRHHRAAQPEGTLRAGQYAVARSRWPTTRAAPDAAAGARWAARPGRTMSG
jgi:multidrug efflux pump subunit AcrA (membrane-fusion protein)